MAGNTQAEDLLGYKPAMILLMIGDKVKIVPYTCSTMSQARSMTLIIEILDRQAM